MSDCVQWCTVCGARFSSDEIEGAESCPKCKTISIPCDPDQDFWVEINWHELRVLGIFASNWADQCDKNSEGNTESLKCVRGILSRLERQFPNEPPLTLGGELRKIRESLAGTSAKIVHHNFPSEGFSIVNGPGAVGHAPKSS